MSKKNEVAEVIINTAVEGKNILTDGIDVVNQLNNKKLASMVKSYYSKVTGMTKSQWEVVRKIGCMCEEDWFSSDFASWTELGAFLGMGKTETSLNRKLAQYETLVLENMGFTVSKAYELIKLDKDQLETFLAGCPDASALTQKELRAAVKEFKETLLDGKVNNVIEENANETYEESGSKLTDLDDTPNDLYVDYILPIWCVDDGGYVLDMNVTLSETDSEDLSKYLYDWFKKHSKLGLLSDRVR